MFLLSALVNTTISELNITFYPDVYPASLLSNLSITVNVTLGEPIDGIEYKYNKSVIWGYQLDEKIVYTDFPQLVVNADNPAVNSTWHSFTITANRCAADSNGTINITATATVQGTLYVNKGFAIVTVTGKRYVTASHMVGVVIAIS